MVIVDPEVEVATLLLIHIKVVASICDRGGGADDRRPSFTLVIQSLLVVVGWVKVMVGATHLVQVWQVVSVEVVGKSGRHNPGYTYLAQYTPLTLVIVAAIVIRTFDWICNDLFWC